MDSWGPRELDFYDDSDNEELEEEVGGDDDETSPGVRVDIDADGDSNQKESLFSEDIFIFDDLKDPAPFIDLTNNADSDLDSDSGDVTPVPQPREVADAADAYKFYDPSVLGKRQILPGQPGSPFPFFQKQKAVECGKHAAAHILYDPDADDALNKLMLQTVQQKFEQILQSNRDKKILDNNGRIATDVDFIEFIQFFNAVEEATGAYRVIVTTNATNAWLEDLSTLRVDNRDTIIIRQILSQNPDLKSQTKERELGYIINTGAHWIVLRRWASETHDYWYKIDSQFLKSVKQPIAEVERGNVDQEAACNAYIQDVISGYGGVSIYHVYGMPNEVLTKYNEIYYQKKIVATRFQANMKPKPKNEDEDTPEDYRRRNSPNFAFDYNEWRNRPLGEFKKELQKKVFADKDFTKGLGAVPPEGDLTLFLSAISPTFDMETVGNALSRNNILFDGENKVTVFYETNAAIGAAADSPC